MFNLYFLLIINLFITNNININPSIIELGEVQYNNFYRFNFILSNKTNHTVNINNVIGDCGCVDFQYSKKNIHPGNSVKILGVQKIIDTVEFTKNIIVYTSSKSKPFLLLEIHGKVNNK